MRIKLIFLFVGIYSFFRIKEFKKIKVCICTIGKQQNLYAREYVNFYYKKGIKKIFIYDNNDKNGENFDLILKDFIDNEFVEIINFRGIKFPQIKAFEDCRKKNFMNYDWLMFYDMDEYIFLRNFSNINDFLNQRIFDKCQRIQLNWHLHTDNNLLYYDNRTLAERFPETDKRWKGIKFGGVEGIKSILKGNINIKVRNPHILNANLISCDAFGNIKKVQGLSTNNSDHYYFYYIRIKRMKIKVLN